MSAAVAFAVIPAVFFVAALWEGSERVRVAASYAGAALLVAAEAAVLLWRRLT